MKPDKPIRPPVAVAPPTMSHGPLGTSRNSSMGRIMLCLAQVWFACALAHAQTLLYSDSFDRADGSINGSADGITNHTGTDLSGGAYDIPYADPSPLSPDGDASNGGGIDISGNKLRLAVGTGTSDAFIRHNFTNASILGDGGFTVSVDITGVSQSTNGQGGGFAVGMSEAEALGTGDALNGFNNPPATTKMTEAFGVTGDVISDFWLVLRANGTLAWGLRGADPTVHTAAVGANTGTISATFTHFADFNAGTVVDYEVFHNGASQGTGSFTWGNNGANFIGLDARDATAVSFDNLEIATLPEAVPTAGLSATPATVPNSSPTAAVALDWTASDLPSGATYAITADKTVGFPNGGSSGPADPLSGSVQAVVDGTAGPTTFTIEISDTTPAVIASATAVVTPTPPNVILIMTDDMGFSDFGCYGSEIHTPRIDSLAANGIRYRNFYNTARCSTTRCALMSGLYTQQGATIPDASLPPLRDDNNVTIAELLSTNGYRRYMTGKWHIGTSNDLSPIGRGFQHIFGQTSGGNFPHNQVSGGNHGSFWNSSNFGFYSENNEIPAIDYPAEYPTTDFHQTTFIGEYALRFIDHHLAKDDGAPFFLYMPFNAVHWDINSPNDMADRYTNVADATPDALTANGGADGGDYYQYEVGWDQTRADRFARQLALGVRDNSWTLTDRSPSIQSTGTSGTNVETPAWADVDGGDDRRADLARRMAHYAAMLEMVDQNVGKVVDKLTTEGLLDNTIIFIIADNGGNYEGGLYGKTAGTSNAAPVTMTTTPNLLEMGQPGYPDLHLGGGWANVNNTPFRLFKHYQHEGGIRTPCIIHWPGGITSPGRWIDDRGHLIDIMATISDVTGTPHPAAFTDPDNSNVRTLLPLEGQSLRPHFNPATTGDFPVRGLGFEHESNRAWFKGNHKFVTKNFTYYDNSTVSDELELYDLSVDPTETNNLATTRPQLLSEMIDDWNAWATRVGVPAERLLVPLGPRTDPTPLDEDLFVDTFNRSNHADHDAGTTGMWGPLLSTLGPDAVYWDSFEGGSTEINSNLLLMAAGSGMTETAIRHNFIDPEILAAGGFSVQLRIEDIASSTDADRYAGIAVGLSAAEAQDGGDIGSGTSFRGRVAGDVSGSADFFIELDKEGAVKTFSNGTLLDSTTVGKTTGNLLVCYETSSFAAGSTVTVTAFLDGERVDLDTSGAATSRTFAWETADTNHIGLSARASTRAVLDNLAVRVLPLSGAMANNHALAAGLSGSDSGPGQDPDSDGDSNFVEWLKAGDPSVSDAGTKLLALAPSPDGEFRFHYTHLNDAAKAGLTYSFRYSTDLAGDPATWPEFTPEPVSSEALGSTHELRVVRVPAGLVTAHNRLFLLLRVD